MTIADVLSGKARWHVETGDCLDILPTLPEGSVDLVLTDPPYGHRNNDDDDLACRWEHALGLVKRGKAEPGEARPIANDGPEANDLLRAALPEIRRVLRPGSCCCCCCGGGGGPDPQFARWSLMLDDAIGFKHAVVWDKGGLGMGWHYRRNYELMLVAMKPGAACNWHGGNDVPNVIRIPGIKPPAESHPTPKPVGLMAHFIRLHSAPGEVVLDPFAGASSSGQAALQLGRRFIGIEIEPKWAELSRERLRAEEQGSTLQARRAGQVPLFGGEK